MTGPIIFSNFRARSELLWFGRVFSLRDNERTTGETWARWTRTGPAKLDVVVEEVARDVDALDVARVE